MWTYYDFVDGVGVNVIRQWRATVPEVVGVALDVTLDLLGGLAPGEWKRTYTDDIHGFPNVRELRFKEERVQWRPLYCFGPGQMEATLLIGASKKGQSWDPRNALGTAQGRSEQVRTSGEGNRHVTFHERATSARDR